MTKNTKKFYNKCRAHEANVEQFRKTSAKFDNKFQAHEGNVEQFRIIQDKHAHNLNTLTKEQKMVEMQKKDLQKMRAKMIKRDSNLREDTGTWREKNENLKANEKMVLLFF